MPTAVLKRLKKHPLLGPVKRGYHWASDRWNTHFGAEWAARLRDAVSAPDNQFIPRVAQAGQIIGGAQVMHNGLRIQQGSYYGYPLTRMLKLNRGVHEPQEERAFAVVLKQMPAGARMLELGAYWGFYSMWFTRDVPDASVYLVEPETENLAFGKGNFELNHLRGDFTQARVGATSDWCNGQRQICVDDFMRERGIEHLNILHSDIQGFEVQMLQGAAGALSSRRVDYIFISTHGNGLHETCLGALREHGYLILADCDLHETFSYDGLIVARSPTIQGPTTIEISRKPASRD